LQPDAGSVPIIARDVQSVGAADPAAQLQLQLQSDVARLTLTMRFTDTENAVMEAVLCADWVLDYYRGRMHPGSAGEKFKKGTHTALAAYLVSLVWPIEQSASESDSDFEARREKYKIGVPEACCPPGVNSAENTRLKAEHEAHKYELQCCRGHSLRRDDAGTA
jgi:hypothetical protein